MSAIVSKVKHRTSDVVDFGGNEYEAPVASARKTPIYAEENAIVSTALITPYNRAYIVSEILRSRNDIDVPTLGNITS
jgi:hypothetical protein